MNKINPKELIEKNPVFESLFAPLYFKAYEIYRENPIIIDSKAVEILKALDYDFSYFEKNKSGQFLIPVRTKILDEQVTKFISGTTNPVVINFGAGLDTRYSRLQTQKCICWYDIDLPEVIDLRSHFFKNTDKNKLIGKSVLDFSWIKEINMEPSFSYLFVVEGLLMYFSESEVAELFSKVKKTFASAIMLCEVFHTKLVNYHLKNKNNTISFKWGIDDTKELELMHPGIVVEGEWKIYEYYKNRQKLFERLLGKILPNFKNLIKIVKIRFDDLPTKN